MSSPTDLKPTDGARFDRAWHTRPHGMLFAAGSPGTDLQASKQRHHFLILSAHEVPAKTPMPQLEGWLAEGDRDGDRDGDREGEREGAQPGALRRLMCLDSGIHNLVLRFASETGTTMGAAIQRAPEDIPGFAPLLDHYRAVITRYRIHPAQPLWGYFELDQGSVASRRATRGALEADGFAPIPIWRAGSDPWEYLEELVRGYDRVGIALFVPDLARVETALIASIWTRWQATNPRCWLHLLGYTPKPLLLAYPFCSADSSDWTSAMRWEGARPRLDTRRFGSLPYGYRHERGAANDGPRGTRRAATLSALNCLFDARILALHSQGFAQLARGDE